MALPGCPGQPARLADHRRRAPADRPAAQRTGTPPPRGHPRPVDPAHPARGPVPRRLRRHAHRGVLVLPSVAGAGRADRAHPAGRRRAEHRADRPRVPGPGGHDGPAHQPGQEDHQGQRRPVRHARRPHRAARRGPAHPLPDLQRGLRGHLGPGPGDRLAVGRGHPPDAHAPPAAARRHRGDGTARADAAHRRAPPARTGPGGELVPMAEQDRSRWDSALIAEGVGLLTRALPRGATGPTSSRRPSPPSTARRRACGRPTGRRSRHCTDC
jgi:Predicted RNA polymerase sigma factor containing a TPR repeat domain